jgi:predicted lipid carrier protein YhbT
MRRLLSRLPAVPAALPVPPLPRVTPPASRAELLARLRPLVTRLPAHPPAAALAVALNRWLLPQLPADARVPLSGRCVEVGITDLGLRLRLVLDARGFRAAPPRSAPQLAIRAALPDYWRLLRGRDDADRLFFERALVLEGDTEMGLVLKNTLDAIGPLWA